MTMKGSAANSANSAGRKSRVAPKIPAASATLIHHGERSSTAKSELWWSFSFMAGRTAMRLGERIFLAQRGVPGGELLLRFLLRHRVGLADPRQEQLAAAGDAVEVVARQPAPARPGVQLVFAPVALDPLPVHGCLIPIGYRVRLRAGVRRCN